MQKFSTYFIISAFLCLIQQAALAEESVDSDVDKHHVEAVDSSIAQPESSTVEEDDSSPTGKEMLSELIIRPVAVVGSITGLALFIVASPFSGLASIPEPHDAFETTWDDFVVTPYHFAFRRPFGDYSVELN